MLAFRAVTGKKMLLSTPDDMVKIEMLKLFLKEKFDIPNEDIRLFYKKRFLQDEMTIAEIGFEEGTEIILHSFSIGLKLADTVFIMPKVRPFSGLMDKISSDIDAHEDCYPSNFHDSFSYLFSLGYPEDVCRSALIQANFDEGLAEELIITDQVHIFTQEEQTAIDKEFFKKYRKKNPAIQICPDCTEEEVEQVKSELVFHKKTFLNLLYNPFFEIQRASSIVRMTFFKVCASSLADSIEILGEMDRISALRVALNPCPYIQSLGIPVIYDGRSSIQMWNPRFEGAINRNQPFKYCDYSGCITVRMTYDDRLPYFNLVEMFPDIDDIQLIRVFLACAKDETITRRVLACIDSSK